MRRRITGDIVVKNVEGLNNTKALNRWRNVVKESFGDDYFETFYGKTVYTTDDVKRFQTVADVLASQPSNRKNLHTAVMTAFSADTPIARLPTEIEALKANFEGRVSKLSEDIRSLLLEQNAINRKLCDVEKDIAIIRECKPRWFKKQATPW